MSITAEERAARLAQLPMEPIGRSHQASFGLLAAAKEIFGLRELLVMLVRRELKGRYKNSTLGFLWTLIRPLTLLLIYFVAIGQFLGAARGTPEFAVFIFTGLTLWTLWSDVITGGTNSIITNAGLIKKVFLPREIFPLASTGSALFNFAVQFLVLLAATIVSLDFPFTWDFLYAVAGFVIVVIWGVAFALILSALNVYLRDVKYLVDTLIQILFWASPIVYPWAFVVSTTNTAGVAWVRELYLLNPFTDAVLAFQRGIWLAGSRVETVGDRVVQPQPWPGHMELRLLVFIVVGIGVLAVAQRIFSRLQGNFAQEI
jgi:ABC-2 type transport system permease protein